MMYFRAELLDPRGVDLDAVRPEFLADREVFEIVDAHACLRSELLLEGPEIDLVRPRRAVLPMNLPVRLGDRLDVQHAVLAAVPGGVWPRAAQLLAVDAAVDDDMRNMEPLRPVLARHALRDHAQAGFRRGELRKARFAAQASRGAGEEHRAAPEP